MEILFSISALMILAVLNCSKYLLSNYVLLVVRNPVGRRDKQKTEKKYCQNQTVSSYKSEKATPQN